MNTPTQPVVTRVAPSPTGLFHIGTARTALFNYLFARKHGGVFLVRIEDTDKERSKPEYEKNILDGLTWLGLTHDRDIVRQSERMARGIYTAHLERLIATDTAFVSKEPAKDDPSRMVEVIRLRNPGRVLTFHDEIRGDITFDTTELGNFVIARSLQDPLYHFAVVVDDAESGVTHVIRGEDHISNTPRQILIQEALGYQRPHYAHLPLILATDRSKLSKRKGAVSVSDYQSQGFLAEALINYLALVGWSPGTDQELFTLDELVQAFSIDGVQKGGAVFDIEKLKWINREHRARMAPEVQLALMLQNLSDCPEMRDILVRSSAAATDILERFSTGAELRASVNAGEFDFYIHRPSVTRDKLTWKKDAVPEKLNARFEHLITTLDALPGDAFTAIGIKNAVWAYAEHEGRGSVLWPMRYALSGKDQSPDPFVLAEALGKAETIARLEAARRAP
jgi:glutamyl-tRNA synthetase